MYGLSDEFVDTGDKYTVLLAAAKEVVAMYDAPDNGRTLRWAVEDLREVLQKQGEL